MIEPLRLTFEVDCPREHAFAVWTTDISRWWPRSHTVSGASDVDVVLETRPGGRIFERTSNGAEHDWGEIVAWDPPHQFGYLWHMRRDRADATEVVVTFTSLVDARTRVSIEHRGWERLGAEGRQWRERNKAGWDGLLPHYMSACAS